MENDEGERKNNLGQRKRQTGSASWDAEMPSRERQREREREREGGERRNKTTEYFIA